MVPTTPPSGPSLCSYSLSIYGERPANPNQYQYGSIGPTDEAGEADVPTDDATVRGCKENNRWRGGSGNPWPSVSYPGKPRDSPQA